MKVKKIPDYYTPFPNMENIDKGSAVYDIVTADHIEKAKQRKKDMEKEFRQARKGVGITDKEYEDGFTGSKKDGKVKSTKQLKAMHLSERLFEAKELPDVKVGDTIMIDSMEGEPQYTGRVGTVKHIDDAGQIHGTWGGCALCSEYGDRYHKVEDKLQEAKMTPEEKKARMKAKWDKKYGTYVAVMNELYANMTANDSGFARTRRFPWNNKITDRPGMPVIPEAERYSQDDIVIDPEDPDMLTYRVYAESPGRLKAAKMICDEYGIPWKEQSAEFRNDPMRRYWIALTFTEDQLEGVDDWDWDADNEEDDDLLTDSWHFQEGLNGDFVTDFVQAASRVCYEHRHDDLAAEEIREAIQTFLNNIGTNPELAFLVDDKKKLENWYLKEGAGLGGDWWNQESAAKNSATTWSLEDWDKLDSLWRAKDDTKMRGEWVKRAEKRFPELDTHVANYRQNPEYIRQLQAALNNTQQQAAQTAAAASGKIAAARGKMATANMFNKGPNNTDVMIKDTDYYDDDDWYDTTRKADPDNPGHSVYTHKKDDYIKGNDENSINQKYFNDRYVGLVGGIDTRKYVPDSRRYIYDKEGKPIENPDYGKQMKNPDYGKKIPGKIGTLKQEWRNAEDNVYSAERKRSAKKADAIRKNSEAVKDMMGKQAKHIAGMKNNLSGTGIKTRF